MACDKCKDKHPGIIPEEVFTCDCECHSWGSKYPNKIYILPDGSTHEGIIALNAKELKALSRALEHTYLPYDDEELHAVVNKIFKVLRESDNANSKIP